MQPIILEKLSKELNDGIDTEPKALYLLAEIRKYIDSYEAESKQKLSSLHFFCDWVLHIDMDRTRAKKILRKFDSDSSTATDLKGIAQIVKSQGRDFYMLTNFKNELGIFLKDHGLPVKTLIETKLGWSRFKKLVLEIIKDCPLRNEDGVVTTFSFVDAPNQQTGVRVKVKDKGSFKIKLKKK